jgi:DNA-directed RNA polymerase specialized sigma24 family protein
LTKNDAEDVLQDTYVKIFRFAHQSATFDSPEAWIWTVVKNTVTDHFRKSGRLESVESLFQDSNCVENIPSPTGEGSFGGVEDCVEKGVNDFSRSMPDRASVIQMVLDGLSVREISQRIVRTEQATAQFLYESRKRLAPFIAPCGEFIGA